MPSDFDNELVKTAALHIKAKEYDIARRYLERALDVVDDEDTRAKASWLMSEITDDPVEKRKQLETVLAWDRNNAQARRALMILDGKLKPEEIVDADHLPAQESRCAVLQRRPLRLSQLRGAHDLRSRWKFPVLRALFPQ